MVTLRWLADRVQPDRANRRTGVVPMAKGLNLGLTAFSPLAGAFLPASTTVTARRSKAA